MTQEHDLEFLRDVITRYGPLDESTVLALIDRVEAAERELVAIKSTQVQHIIQGSFETARAAGIAIDEAVRVVAGWLVNDPDRRAREAEQAVERVRELREGQLCGHCADEVQDALEGELE